MTTKQTITLDEAKDTFLRGLRSKNRSAATVVAYTTDLNQFLRWVQAELSEHWVHQVEREDINEYLATLADRKLSGVSRARKLAAIREYFRFLVANGYLTHAPTDGIDTPKQERNIRTYLTPGEYTRMLAGAGSKPRDYAILQVFLQTGVRVSELCALKLDDVDLQARVVRVTAGKGMVAREIPLEKKGIQAIRNWLDARPTTPYDELFLNNKGQPIGERGVRFLVHRYRVGAGITKPASCHSFRHTFASAKAEHPSVLPHQLKDWLGHAKLETTMIYVHRSKQNDRKVMEATSL